MNDKIKDNPSTKKLKEEMDAMFVLLNVSKIFGVKQSDSVLDIEDRK